MKFDLNFPLVNVHLRRGEDLDAESLGLGDAVESLDLVEDLKAIDRRFDRQ